LTNTANTPNQVGPIGGHEAYAAYGNAGRSFNVRLRRSGYTTGYIGKFLNQYEYNPGRPIPAAPPGWSDWRVLFGSAYDGWDFHSSYLEGGRVKVRHHPAPPASASAKTKDAAYAGTVIHRMALDFIRSNQKRSAPYFLQVAPFAPHSRVNPTGHYPGDPAFPPAFRDRPRPGQPLGNCGAISCGRLGIKHLPGYGDDLADNRPRRADGKVLPSWRPKRTGLTRAGAVASLRNRARMAQSVDRMMHDLLDAVDDNTIVMLTSDNGFHLGQHGLGVGKSAPYDSDVRVPLYVVGPGVKRGVRDEMVSNIDLAATFEDLAGLRPPKYRAGSSIAPTFARPARAKHRYTFFEHTWAPSLG
ncbi:MAG: sulfatase-like hydrolase/transferase, partial [bacterium]|nr:sulfatase-like hydrolase/transferase [bacterium]